MDQNRLIEELFRMWSNKHPALCRAEFWTVAHAAFVAGAKFNLKDSVIQKWININDEKPMFYHPYGESDRIILFDGKESYASELEEKDIVDWHITHWMPMPPNPLIFKE